VGSSSVTCGQAVGNCVSTPSADVVVEALVYAGDLLLALLWLVVAVFCECCECESSARMSGFCSTSDLTSRGSAPAAPPPMLCSSWLCTSVAECSASLLSEMLFRSVLGALGRPASLPALLTFERVVVLVALLLRRNLGKNRRDDLMLLIPASSRWP
jgi:hypothetical protein